MSRVQQLYQVLKNVRFPVSDEKLTQQKIAVLICPLGFEREYRLDEKNIPDFFAEGVAVEVKIKGQRTAIYKQLQRYAKFEQVKILVLISGRAMGLPADVDGKPVYYINLSKAFL